MQHTSTVIKSIIMWRVHHKYFANPAFMFLKWSVFLHQPYLVCTSSITILVSKILMYYSSCIPSFKYLFHFHYLLTWVWFGLYEQWYTATTLLVSNLPISYLGLIPGVFHLPHWVGVWALWTMISCNHAPKLGYTTDVYPISSWLSDAL